MVPVYSSLQTQLKVLGLFDTHVAPFRQGAESHGDVAKSTGKQSEQTENRQFMIHNCYRACFDVYGRAPLLLWIGMED